MKATSDTEVKGSMSPEKEDEESPRSEDASGKAEETTGAETSQSKAAKRRTKTGCLTCRKRRIKCGEEKPICKNCIKSKRECAGYVQPLVYKQQNHGHSSAIRDMSNRPFSGQDESFTTASYFNPGLQQDQQFFGAYPALDATSLPSYQQLPLGQYDQNIQTTSQGDVSYREGQSTGNHYGWQANQFPSQPMYHGIDMAGSIAPVFQTPYNDETASTMPIPLDPALVSPSIYSNPQALSQEQMPLSAFAPAFYDFPQQRQAFEPIHHRPLSMVQQYGVLQANIADNVARRYSVHGFVQHPSLTTSVQTAAIATAPLTNQQENDDEYEDPDDPFDVEMEEQDVSLQDAAQNLTEILDRSGQRSWRYSKQNVSRRPQQQTIATFTPTLTISPLRDERNERIFCHFVEISSHCMSIFERHHFSPISAPVRTLWNFTIPALALSHAALAHAILALGALHLAKLQGSSEDIAIKHFTYSVRRVGKLLGLPKRRYEIATLATVLVLGFYEVVTGDHSRWNLHLRGATKLVQEHDYAGLTRTARRMRSGAKARVNQWTAQFALTEENYGRVASIPLALLDDLDWEVNTELVSQLTGRRIDFDKQVQPNYPQQDLIMDLSEKDVDEFKAKMDLRWWYCKQDIFQSMVSGDPLLMPYENWAYCPPRGQIGRADNPYATVDHYMLVMARLVDFGGKDRHRKQRAVTAQGGQWRPPMWLFGPQGPPGPPQDGMKSGPGQPSQSNNSRPSKPSSTMRPEGHNTARPSQAPSANEGRVRQSKPTVPGPSGAGTPPMYGMIPPPTETLQLNSAFKSMDASINDPAFQPKREDRQSTPPSSLEEETRKAFADHAQISKAFDVFKSSLGPEFEPLQQSASTPLTTPFGPALIYRNAAVACIWLFYHVGRILLWRFHPEMPPAAMVAAGVSAHLTKDHAQMVGKICAGLYSSEQYDGQRATLDPSFAGALMESTFQLLFAAVQYQDAAQRGWTITKLQDVARRCGWQTSGAVAAACEIAWERMGQAGRGPPYERTLDVNNKDARVSGAYSKSDSSAAKSQRASNPVAEHESEFVNHDRSLIDRSGSTRTHWALGLLSVEEDIKNMNLGSD